jgi:hypothetical protein
VRAWCGCQRVNCQCRLRVTVSETRRPGTALQAAGQCPFFGHCMYTDGHCVYNVRTLSRSVGVHPVSRPKKPKCICGQSGTLSVYTVFTQCPYIWTLRDTECTWFILRMSTSTLSNPQLSLAAAKIPDTACTPYIHLHFHHRIFDTRVVHVTFPWTLYIHQWYTMYM